jgi:hypothetical protein
MFRHGRVLFLNRKGFGCVGLASVRAEVSPLFLVRATIEARYSFVKEIIAIRHHFSQMVYFWAR